MPDTPDAVRLVLCDALAEVYVGADLVDVDALLDQMTDRGLRVAALAVHVCPPCPHIQTSDEGTSYCDLAEHAIAYHCDEAARLREALEEAVLLLRRGRADVRAAISNGTIPSGGWTREVDPAVAALAGHLPTGGAE